MPVEIALGAVLGALAVAVVMLAMTLWVPTLRRREETDDPDAMDMAENILSLQRSIKLIQGKLNRENPPRLGTGETVVAPGATVDVPATRAEVLATYRRRRG